MKKTKKRLGEYWDSIILKNIPFNANFKKIEEEVKEHFNLMGLMIKRILLPLISLYIIFGLVFNINIFGSLFVSMIIFLYSNFLPDIDFLIKKTERPIKNSLWYDKYFLLFFAPIAVYYAIIGKAKPIYSLQDRYFHNIRSSIIYAVFLVVVGHIFWDETIKIIMFVILGTAGYLFHLIIDEIILGSKFVKSKIRSEKLKQKTKISFHRYTKNIQQKIPEDHRNVSSPV